MPWQNARNMRRQRIDAPFAIAQVQKTLAARIDDASSAIVAARIPVFRFI